MSSSLAYQQLFSPLPLQVREQKSSYSLMTERHIQVLWLEQKFFLPLKTIEGEVIEVLSPGFWNSEAGPDFLKAHLKIGNSDYRGDIEIHLSDEGWHQHGHDQDKRYNQVILHVAFWPSLKSRTIKKENGQLINMCYLQEFLKETPQRLLQLIDLDLYPSQRFVGRGRCAEGLFKFLPDGRIKALFQSASYWRLERKSQFLKHHFLNPADQFLGGVAMALGYKHNAMPFLELFRYLLAYRDLPYQELLAIALGCCGFLEENRKKEWEQSSYYQHLRFLWWGRRSEVTLQVNLKLDHIRPLHHPVRRLAYLTRLLQDPHSENKWTFALNVWEQAVVSQKRDFKELKDQFLRILPAYPDEYWDYHYTFETKEQAKILSDLGKEIKIQMILNTFFPLLYAYIRNQKDHHQWDFFQHFYESWAHQATSKSRYLLQRFFVNEREELFNKAQTVQGAYQLHHDFCMHFEASCEGCPFVERFLESWSQ